MYTYTHEFQQRKQANNATPERQFSFPILDIKPSE